MDGGDYIIVVQGFSKANMTDDPLLAEWIKTADGHIDMPYRDVIKFPNYGQTSDFRMTGKSAANLMWKNPEED